jgi:uncharacterized protein YcbK (DUF882 family)
MKNIDVKLTANFTLKEFINSTVANQKGITEQFMPDFKIVQNLEKLCINLLQPLREKVGKITINSGYRCKRLNDAVKGSVTSQHLIGCAADIVVANKLEAIAFIKAAKFDQLIIYPNFLHISFTSEQSRKSILYR